MPLPDPNADEPVAEVDHGLWIRYQDAKSNAAQWDAIAKNLRAKLLEGKEDVFALTFDGVKIATNRPTSKYAEARLQKDYPELTRHYRHTVTDEVFNLELFVKAHPEIAEAYRVRSFREVEQ